MSTPANFNAVTVIILSDRRISLKQIHEAVNVSNERIHHIVHVDLGMRKIFAKLVHKCLNVDQKRERANRSEKRKETKDSDFLSRVVTVDETWVHLYDPETSKNRWSGSTRIPQGLRTSVFKNGLGKFLVQFFETAKG